MRMSRIQINLSVSPLNLMQSLEMPPSPRQPKAEILSELPSELIQEICSKLPSIIEYIQFRSVCRSWRLAASRANLHPQLPWVILDYNLLDEVRRFLCLSTGIIHTLHLPGTGNKQVCGSGHGWIALAENNTTVITLINPITRSLINLPRSSFKGRIVDSASISANPNSASGCFVACTITCSKKVAFCSLSPSGSSKWCMIDTGLEHYVHFIAFHRGKLCVIDISGSVAICDTSLKNAVILIHKDLPPFGQGWTLENWRIVDSSEDLLLLAHYRCPLIRQFNKKDCIAIYRLDMVGQKTSWVLSRTIEEGEHYSPLCGFFGQFLGYRECLYHGVYMQLGGEECLIVRVLDVKNGNIKKITFKGNISPGIGATWLVPSLM